MRWVLGLVVSVLLAGAAAAQTLPPGVSAADQAAIRGVIGRQLEAFQKDDAAGAYSFAAPNVRAIFPDQERFMEMVRRGYPPVYRPRQTEFSELGMRDGALVQEVELVGPDGKPVLALYSMTPDGKGGWLISGCTLIASVRVGA